jgi:hypothetical protein
MTSSRRLARTLLAFSALCAATATPALAQGYGGGFYNSPPPPPAFGFGRPLPPGEIRDLLEDDGYEVAGPLRFAGSTYEVDAIDEDGRRVRLSVDAFRGRVLERRLAGRPIGRPYDEIEIDPVPSRRQAGRPGPLDEMPEAELRRRGEYIGPGPGGLPPGVGAPDRLGGLSPAEPTPRLDPIRPVEIAPVAPLPAPSDPRLAPSETRRAAVPSAPSATEPTPPREAGRNEPVFGTNPGAAKPAARPQPPRSANVAPREPEPKPAVSATPPAPVPPATPPATVTVAPKPEGPTAAKPEGPTAADAANRASRPVRVIEGVTPVPGGQAGTAPQNQLAAQPKPPGQ